MSFYKCLVSLFNELNSQNIHYCLIRDFENTEQVNTSKDIDIVIKKSEKNNAKKILASLGWVTPRINKNLYAHEQFYKWNGTRLVELDVLWDIYYSDGKYKLTNQDDVFVSQGQLEQAKIPRNEVALRLLVLHLVFDKDNVSEKNLNQLKRLIDIQENRSGIFYEIAHSIIERGGYDSEMAYSFNKRLLSEDVVTTHFSFHIKPIRKCKIFLSGIALRIKWSRCFKLRQDPLKIAIMGVDGSGKSSAIRMLQGHFKNSFVQYMGFRNDSWESELAKKIRNNKQPEGSESFLSRFFHVRLLKFYYVMVYEGYYRYMKAVRSGANVVLFDRYYWEIYDNTNNTLSRIVYYIFLKMLYPKPELQVYLHCPIEESLRRKDDIDDVDDFIRTKNKWDKIYLNRKDVLAIDTSEHSINEVCGRIIEQLVKVH